MQAEQGYVGVNMNLKQKDMTRHGYEDSPFDVLPNQYCMHHIIINGCMALMLYRLRLPKTHLMISIIEYLSCIMSEICRICPCKNICRLG